MAYCPENDKLYFMKRGGECKIFVNDDFNVYFHGM